MKPRKPNLNEAQRKWVQDWWKALQPRRPEDPRPTGELAFFDRGTRALLRRTREVDTLVMQRAVLVLGRELIRRGGSRWPLHDGPDSYDRIAVVAGVLAHVTSDSADGSTLGKQLGTPQAGIRPVMNELRFQSLQRARDMSDLFQQWRRAVQLAPRTDLAQLADDLLTWLAELQSSSSIVRVHDSVKFRWAYDYYLANKSGDTSDSRDSVSH